MPTILLLGATGHIGSHLLTSLQLHGTHTIHALARTPAKATALAARGTHPLLLPDPVAAPAELTAAIGARAVDIVIDVAGADAGSHALLAGVVAAARARAPRRLGFVYTSGTWVHGDARTAVREDEEVGQGPVPPLVRWRVGMEEAVREAGRATPGLDVAVVRPALVYGADSPIWGGLFGQVFGQAGTAEVSADPDAVLSLVHVRDVGEGMAALVRRWEGVVLPATARGEMPVFDLAGSVEGMGAVMRAFAAEVGFKGALEWRVPDRTVAPDEDKLEAFYAAMSTSAIVRAERAREMLGWAPSSVGMVASMDTVAMAWVAAQQA